MLETDSLSAQEGPEGLGGLSPDLSIGELAVGKQLAKSLEELNAVKNGKATLLDALAREPADASWEAQASNSKEGKDGDKIYASAIET